jgi:hypothetical protein
LVVWKEQLRLALLDFDDEKLNAAEFLGRLREIAGLPTTVAGVMEAGLLESPAQQPAAEVVSQTDEAADLPILRAQYWKLHMSAKGTRQGITIPATIFPPHQGIGMEVNRRLWARLLGLEKAPWLVDLTGPQLRLLIERVTLIKNGHWSTPDFGAMQMAIEQEKAEAMDAAD